MLVAVFQSVCSHFFICACIKASYFHIQSLHTFTFGSCSVNFLEHIHTRDQSKCLSPLKTIHLPKMLSYSGLNIEKMFILIGPRCTFDCVCFQAETTAGKLKKQEDETGLLHQRLRGAEEDLKDASLQIQEQKETVAILKQKYAAAIDKVHSVQGRVEVLEEELRYSQQQVDNVCYQCMCTVVHSSV